MAKRTRRPWSPEEVAQLRQLIVEGLTYNAIAQRMGRTYRSIRGAAEHYQLARELGRRPIGSGVVWSRADYDRLEALVAQGLTKDQIGEQMGRSYNQVRGAMARIGLTDPARRGHNRKDWPEIEPIILDCIQVERMTVPQIESRLRALGYRISRNAIHTRIKGMPASVRKEMRLNAQQRRGRMRSLKAQRERARARVQGRAA
ncbi:hypothetical protein [Halomonas rhizosphaerae]|uniref:Myb-like domain-containing protein n=1 Tax=Halomonas rhizosphaerae TaxID=3043296 RepID=A0ABT6UZF5_9GAMM|nr:hypothetical protein [Halomonas rhizosphaerae]MDI5890643.1 hypothetical protein [Halomonas rhizosphaerae]